MNKIFISIFFLVVVTLAGWATYMLSLRGQSATGQQASVVQDEQPVFLSPAVSQEDHFKGGAQAPVTLVEYGDFECPACSAYFPLVRRLQEDFGDQLKIVYRHFPLRNIHPRADSAAQATEAAALQGKFWEMHDLLYEKQEEWVRLNDFKEKFVEYAAELGLDAERFQQDRDSDLVRSLVEQNLQSALASEASGTPTFYVQGQRIRAPQSYSEFQQLILAALVQAQEVAPEAGDSESSNDSPEETE